MFFTAVTSIKCRFYGKVFNGLNPFILKNRIVRLGKHLQKTAGQKLFPFFSYKSPVVQTNKQTDILIILII